MPHRRLIALNGNAGAFVSVLSTQASRKLFVREDESVAATQGLQYQTPDDGFTQTYTIGVPGTPDEQQISLPMVHSQIALPGPLLGLPAQTGLYNRPADTYIKLRSKTVTATSVRVVEED